MSYDKYLQQKADFPLYLATAEPNQTGNLQAELSDRNNNVTQKIKKSSADLINFYEGAEVSSSIAKFIAASLLKMITVSAFVKFIGDFAGGYGKGMNGYYNDQTDTVVIFADNIQNTDHLEKTFAHETAGHKGLQVLLGNEYTSIIDEIYSAVNQKHGAELQELAATYGQDLNTIEGQRYIIEEYLANQADLQKLSGFKSFVQKIKLALRKVGFRAKWTDDEITTLMRRSLENVRKQRSATDNGGVRYSKNHPYYLIPWKEGLKNVVTDKSIRQSVFVSETPDVFKKIGFTSLPMMMNARHLRLNYYNRADFEQNFGKMRQGEHAHNLRDELEKLPAALENPLAIVVNKTPNAKPGSIVAITDINVDGKKVVVPILIEAINSVDNGRIDSHLILTVYDSNNWIETFLTPAIEAEKNGIGIFYFDKEKADKYGALSKKKGSIPTGFVHNIADIGLNVKSQTETFQFKNWFGDSKVVDENGNPLVVYHGSGTTFWEFKTEFTGLGKNMYKKRKSTANLFVKLRKNLKVAGLDKEPLGDCA